MFQSRKLSRESRHRPSFLCFEDVYGLLERMVGIYIAEMSCLVLQGPYPNSGKILSFEDELSVLPSLADEPTIVEPHFILASLRW
ncbi:hypothetical protein SLA2020_276110 [Shorea laevis]